MSGSGSDLPGVVPFANKHPQLLTSHERDDAICAPCQGPGWPRVSARAPPDTPRALHLRPQDSTWMVP